VACYKEVTGFTSGLGNPSTWKAETVETKYEDRAFYASLQSSNEYLRTHNLVSNIITNVLGLGPEQGLSALDHLLKK
jgi:hypothetical protein